MMVDEKQIQDQAQVHVQVQQALKCPRCDSSNTKFCYYNNYSLSQPRHFCKACKRYWTRGGTLRNVPVGGGYRKHKRVKQSTSSLGPDISSSAPPVVNPNTVQSSQMDVSLSSTRTTDIGNNLFYSLLANNISELNFPYSTREGYGNGGGGGGGGGGLGFLTGSDSVTSQNLGLSNGDRSIVASLNPLLSSYPIYGTSNYTCTSTMASTIASSLHQQKMAANGFKDNAQIPYGAMGFDDLQRLAKDVKMEGQGNNLLDWSMNHTYTEEINSSDPSFVWNSLAAGVRFNPSNIGPSVSSMI